MEYLEAHGMTMPALGFGTFQLSDGEAREMVEHALQLGYRHIDTAQMYDNERGVGQAIRASGVERASVFLTTKIWMDQYRRGDLEASVDASLTRLGSDYVDLLLLHWPEPSVPLEETLTALMAVKRDGRARHIGVSNFPNALLREAVSICGPGELVTNQVEYHVFLSQREVRAELERQGMVLTAYCPLAQGRVFGDPTLEEIGAKHGKSEAQVALRWLLDQGCAAIPRTRRRANAAANLEVLDFALDAGDHELIDARLQGDTRVIDPSFAPHWDRP